MRRWDLCDRTSWLCRGRAELGEEQEGCHEEGCEAARAQGARDAGHRGRSVTLRCARRGKFEELWQKVLLQDSTSSLMALPRVRVFAGGLALSKGTIRGPLAPGPQEGGRHRRGAARLLCVNLPCRRLLMLVIY